MEATVTGVHPKTGTAGAAELGGNGSCLDRATRNDTSFPNSVFAAFSYLSSNIPVLYQERIVTRRFSSPVLSLDPFVSTLFLLKEGGEQKNGKI